MVHLGNPMPNDMKSNICVGEVISSLPNTRLEDVDDDDELMLNVLRCHLTY